MREYRYKNNNHYIIALILAVVALVSINSGYVFWQTQQIKQTFDNAANRDLTIAAKLTPLIDRQIEQTLIINRLSRIGQIEQHSTLDIIESSFIRTGEKFEQDISELISFVRVKVPAADLQDRQDLLTFKNYLENIQLTHQKYQQQVIWMLDGMQGKSYDYVPSSVRLVAKYEKQLMSELEALGAQITRNSQFSNDKISYYDALMVKQTIASTVLVFALCGVLFFFTRQLMLSRARAVEEINYFATFDSLTKLLNRRYFNERLEQAIKSATRHEQTLSLCVCDIDNFQHVVEVYGKKAGDIALAGFADILAEQMRATDVAGRFGPDEFVFFFPSTSAFEAEQMLKRIRRVLNGQTFTNDAGESFSVTATFGIAELNSEYKSSAALLGAADRALYKAREKGRDLIYALV